jgi:ADP-ribose pyrophosphatase
MFKILSRQEIFSDRLLTFRVDEVETFEGRTLNRNVIEYHEAAATVVLSGKKEVLLIKHFRYPVGKFIWEIPGGIIQKGEDAKTCALRELREETGYQARFIDYLLSYFPEPEFSTQIVHLFIASDLRFIGNWVEENEIEDLQFFSKDRLLGMIDSKDIMSSWSLIGILYALKDL